MSAAGAAAQERIRELFDDAGSEAWQILVYEPVHAGWRFTNIGGQPLLDGLGRRLRPGSTVLELGCGLGDTACYLAERWGARVTGIDSNGAQLAAARRNRDERHPAVSGRVRFRQADLARWRPTERFAAVLVLDTLMYLENRAAVLAAAWGALEPGGLLWMAEVLAGPRYGPELAQWLASSEGVATLPTPESHRAELVAAGFVPIHDTDRSARAVDVFQRICRANREERERLAAIGAHRHLDPTDNERHLAAFASGELVYRETGARPLAR